MWQTLLPDEQHHRGSSGIENSFFKRYFHLFYDPAASKDAVSPTGAFASKDAVSPTGAFASKDAVSPTGAFASKDAVSPTGVFASNDTVSPGGTWL
jgi:hypothetical protein